MSTIDGVELKIARIRAGLKQYQLACKVSITQTKLSEIECGRLQPNAELMQRIIEALKDKQCAKSK